MKWRPIEAWNPKKGGHPPGYGLARTAIVYNGDCVQQADWWPDRHNKMIGEWWPANLDSEYGERIYPTHWMPLPKPPKP